MLFFCKNLHTGDSMADTTKIMLDETEIPKTWFNLVPHLPNPPAPPLHAATHQPVGPADLAPLFCDDILGPEMAAESPLSCAAFGESPRYAGAHLLQV